MSELNILSYIRAMQPGFKDNQAGSGRAVPAQRHQ